MKSNSNGELVHVQLIGARALGTGVGVIFGGQAAPIGEIGRLLAMKRYSVVTVSVRANEMLPVRPATIGMER